MSTSSSSPPMMWGEWMGAWKQNLDQETERIDRQKAAFGADSVARIKDLNVLVIGLQGVGVETAKNLILSNVGSLTLWDPLPAQHADRGTNFYLRSPHVQDQIRRDEACLADLKSLNPFCKVQVLTTNNTSTSNHSTNIPNLVEALQTTNVAGTGKGYAAIVITSLPTVLHSQPSTDYLFQLNEHCRQQGIAFVMACNHGGITASIFSDFGKSHEITDEFGEPTKLLALSAVEVIQVPSILQIQGVPTGSKVVILTVAQSDHGLDNGDSVQFDDLEGTPLEPWNGKTFGVQRVAFRSPTAAGINAQDVTFQEILKQPTHKILDNFDKQLQFYQSQHDDQQQQQQQGGASAGATTPKLPLRTITMFNRLALVLPPSDDTGRVAGVSWDEMAHGYQSGGLLQQVRPVVTKEYSSLQETLEQTPVPQMLRGDDWEAGKGIETHLAYSAVLTFYDQHQRWPGLHSLEDAEDLVQMAQTISDQRQADKEEGTFCWAQKVSYGFPTGDPRSLQANRLRAFSSLFSTELTGLCAFLGGAAAQEVLKTTGKFTPLNQWIHHDEPSLLSSQTFYDDPDPNGFGASVEDRSNHGPLLGSRYDHQIAILGKDFQAKLADQTVFLVGCGALGCEYLKGLSLMGVAAGTNTKGKIWVTDMDRIEVSNLSRQFLFRDHDVGHPKSVRGAKVVQEWNPQLNIEALERKVGTDTEDFFDDAFWGSLSVCWNALDNVQARKYTDAQCLLHSKPLLESGTLGTKCNHEVILPFRTSTYNDGKESDDNENQIAMCTLRSFPYLPIHCIEFAKQAYFSDYFEFGPDQYETFRKDAMGFMEQLDGMEEGEQLKALQMIHSYIDLQQEQEGGRMTFGACVEVAHQQMMADFSTSIKDLCHSADAMEASSGNKFWTGTKRRPKPIEWPENFEEVAPELLEYLYCTANMYAVVWGVEPIRDRQSFHYMVASMGLSAPEWKPSSKGIDLSEGEATEEAAAAGGGDVAAIVEDLKAKLYQVDPSTLSPAVPHDFEKDEDSNFHIDFLTVATNLRAWNYDIKASPRHTVKVTAGRIIPALATTTAMVCGLVDMEFCKLVLGLESSMGRGPFLNSNINLAAGSGNFTTFSPDPPIPLETGLPTNPKTFTSWDHITLAFGPDDEELSVSGLVEYLEATFGVVVDRIFDPSGPAEKALYSAVDRKKLGWDILGGGNTGSPLVVSEGVYTQWPQLRMAVQMLGRLPPTSGQRKIFEGQIEKVKVALQATKASLEETLAGPVSSAHQTVYRPSEEDDGQRTYFDAVQAKRDYCLLGVHCRTSGGDEGEDVRLPSMKYVVAKKKQ